jgi:hypothetical protein
MIIMDTTRDTLCATWLLCLCINCSFGVVSVMSMIGLHLWVFAG